MLKKGAKGEGAMSRPCLSSPLHHCQLNSAFNIQHSALPPSVPRRVLDRFQDVGRLRQDHFLEVRTVRNRRVERGDALDWGVQVFEQLFANPRSELGAKAA